MPEETVTVFFDYLCPYAWRSAELAGRVAQPLDLRFEWRHFSLYQARHAGRDGWQLWNDRIDPSDDTGGKGLLPFLASVAASRQKSGEGFDRFRLALMRLRHRHHMPYRRATMLAAAETAGLHLACFERDLDDPEARTALARDHHRAAALDVTGSPTVRFASGHSAHLRLKEIPNDPVEAVDLFRGIRSMLERHPYLETLERPRVPCN